MIKKKSVPLAALGFILALCPMQGQSAPLAVGAVADNVGYAEGTNFTGSYQSLEQRHLSDYPEHVIVLVYFTPW